MKIDNKDKSAAHRTAVFEEVQRVLDFTGSPPSASEFFHGRWIYRFHVPYAAEQSANFAFQSFHADGAAPIAAVDGSFNSPKDKWVLNDDGSFSCWSFVEPMPEYGITEATYSEDRYHVIVKNQDEFVLFNGDGSLIMVYLREVD